MEYVTSNWSAVMDLYGNSTFLSSPLSSPFAYVANPSELPRVFSSLDSTLLPSSPLLACTVSLSILSLSVYIKTWISFVSRKSSSAAGAPPIVPYMIPFLGSAARFAMNPSKCLAAGRQMLGSRTAFGLQILNNRLYFIHGTENIAVLWKNYSTGFSTPDIQAFVLRTVFGMPRKALEMYYNDKSGMGAKPATDIDPKNRIDYLTAQSFHKFLNGEKLAVLFGRWAELFADTLPELPVSEQWTTLPDIMDFWLLPSTAALNRALTGDLLDAINPDFHRDFLAFIPHATALMTGLPRWCFPRAHALRRSVARDVRQWHAIAQRRFRPADVDARGFDPWWGSQFFRERQAFLGRVDHFGAEAVAALDVGLLWGAAINVHPMAIWAAVEVFKRPELVQRVRAELASIGFRGLEHGDADKVLALPLLQAVYAEATRLHTETQTLFYSHTREMRVGAWRFPRESVVMVPNAPVLRDPAVWNTRGGQYPVDTFWPDRFLAYPGDPQSGPLRPKDDAAKVGSTEASPAAEGAGEPRFVSSGLTNTFIPYGLGERICPGRFLAKRLIMAFCAEVVWRYDMEILHIDERPKISLKYYGLGTERPAKKVPFRIRRRNFEEA